MNESKGKELAGAVKRFAEENGCLSGVCAATPSEGLRERLARKATPFVSRDIDRRVDPAVYLAGAKSVVVLGRMYSDGGNGCDGAFPADNVGLMTAMAGVPDYHAALRGLLEDLARRLSEIAAFSYVIKVDSGGLAEREYAMKAGLGFQGKNCSVISPSAGSFFNIGLMIVDVEIYTFPSKEGDHPAASRHPSKEGDHPAASRHPSKEGNGCGGCRLCIDACPAEAIMPGGYEIDPFKCVSYLTQKDGEPAEAERKAMGRWVYGCDVCQAVCPFNAGKTPKPVELDLDALLAMDSAEFDRVFAGTCAAWKKRETLRRNAENAKWNE